MLLINRLAPVEFTIQVHRLQFRQWTCGPFGKDAADSLGRFAQTLIAGPTVLFSTQGAAG